MEYGKNNYIPPLFGSWTFGVPLIAKLVFDPPLHLLVCVCYSLVIYQPFTQSFSYFLWWRLCSFSSSSPFPGLNIARLFVCVVGNWSNSKPPPSSSWARGVVDGHRPLSCHQSSSIQRGGDAAGREPGAPPSALTLVKICLGIVVLLSLFSKALWPIIPSAHHLQWIDVFSYKVCDVASSPCQGSDPVTQERPVRMFVWSQV